MPYGIEIVQVGPSTLTMEFEMSGMRTVPVEPDDRGPAGARLRSDQGDERSGDGRSGGPESALKRLQAAITEPVSVSDQTRPVREVVTIGVPDSSLRLRSPQTAVVTVTIAPRQP